MAKTSPETWGEFVTPLVSADFWLIMRKDGNFSVVFGSMKYTLAHFSKNARSVTFVKWKLAVNTR